MSFPIERKLVIAVASSALFDLAESDAIYKKDGIEAYRLYQRKHLDEPFPKGVAFPFIRRLLGLNRLYEEEQPVEVIFLSKNDAESGRRLYRSAQYHGLNITRGAFLAGGSPYPYIPAFNASLFLSADKEDVVEAVYSGFPAGMVLPSNITDDEDEKELRIAFDFDGVLADDESEREYVRTGDLEKFHENETSRRAEPHKPGPLKDLLEKISRFQRVEKLKSRKDKTYKPALRIAIITARNAPSNERFVTTMENWGISVDETFFLGGIEKKHILNVLKPHIFFDDQIGHLEPTAQEVPSVHIPFGIKNVSMAVEAPEGDTLDT